MALTKEDLQAIRTIVQEENAPITARLDAMDDRLDEMQENLNEVRESTNALIAWADNVSVITQIKFPVEK